MLIVWALIHSIVTLSRVLVHIVAMRDEAPYTDFTHNLTQDWSTLDIGLVPYKYLFRCLSLLH